MLEEWICYIDEDLENYDYKFEKDFEINIEYWFNNITGIDNSYNKLIEYLLKANELTKKKNKTIFGKNKTINKLKELYKNILEIINTFNNNCNFK